MVQITAVYLMHPEAFYTFAGWYTSANSGTYISSNSTYYETNDITLYAHWNEISVKDISGIPEKQTIGVGE